MKSVSLYAVIALCLSSSLQGQQIIQTQTFGPSIPRFDTLMTFNSYAGDLSDIESIQISWTMEIQDGYLVIDNDAVESANGNYEFGASIGVNDAVTDVTLLDATFNAIFTSTEVVNSGTFSLSGNVGDGPNDFSADGPDGTGVTGSTVNGSGGGNVNSIFYGQYVSGNGGSADATFDIGISTEQYLIVNSNGGTEYAITPVNAIGEITLTYNLVPVPEPTSMLMLLAGGCFTLLRRAR
ncbi:MAG: PEP-CTERM sorting domain-containing protein [Akkermansiaceae bacterium]